MSDKPRRWFQVHLSTAVVMMFVAGGLLWLQFYRYLNTGDASDIGWPLTNEFSNNADDSLSWEKLGYPHVPYISVLLDIFFSANILLIATIASEFLIRRRENK